MPSAPERGEGALHGVDLPQIGADVLAAAALLGVEPEASLCKRLPRRHAAQVHDRGQVLLLAQRGAVDLQDVQRAPCALVEKGGSHFRRVAGYDSEVKPVEPARAPCIPGPVFRDFVVVDAVALRLLVGAVGDLEHAYGARGGAVDVERVFGQAPAPGRARHRIARALDLRERGEEIRRDRCGGVRAEDRLVAAPGFRGQLVQGTAHRREELGGLARELHQRVGGEPEREAHGDAQRDQQRGRGAAQLAPCFSHATGNGAQMQ